MQKQYRAEFFDRQFNYIGMRAMSTPDIDYDYLTLTAFSAFMPWIDVPVGCFCNIVDESGAIVYQGTVGAVDKPGDGTADILIQPLGKLFDISVQNPGTVTAEQFIMDALTAAYINSGDPLQNIPGLTITANSSTPYTPPAEAATELFLYIINVFSALGVVVNTGFDVMAKTFTVSIGKITGVQTIEADLKNCAARSVTIGNGYGELNKVTYFMESAPATSVTYYRHNDGTVDTVNADRVTPVFFATRSIAEETPEEMQAKAAEEAVKDLAIQAYQNLIELSYVSGDRLVRPEIMRIGQQAHIVTGGRTYVSILTGKRQSGSLITLVFGLVRADLTKILAVERKR